MNRILVTGKRRGKRIVISVSDNGKGIPETLHRKVFEPFYTTAREQGGTGLGLNILYNLIGQKLGGEPFLASVPNAGTTVTAVIPQTELPKTQNRADKVLKLCRHQQTVFGAQRLTK